MRSATRCGWLSGLKLMKMMLAEGAAHSGLIDRDFINDYRDSAAQFVDPRLRRAAPRSLGPRSPFRCRIKLDVKVCWLASSIRRRLDLVELRVLPALGHQYFVRT